MSLKWNIFKQKIIYVSNIYPRIKIATLKLKTVENFKVCTENLEVLENSLQSRTGPY